ncbi:MAG TPA: STAS domain-containing protein [Thermoleophilaceae bacterium]
MKELESTVLMRMVGDIDFATINQVMAAVERVDLDRITLLVIDLQDVEFLDLAGLHAVLRVNDQCERHDVRCTVLSPRGPARRVFTLTRAHQELDFVDAGVGAAR